MDTILNYHVLTSIFPFPFLLQFPEVFLTLWDQFSLPYNKIMSDNSVIDYMVYQILLLHQKIIPTQQKQLLNYSATNCDPNTPILYQSPLLFPVDEQW